MEIQIHRTEISQGQNGSDEEALQRLTSTIFQKIGEGANKSKSIFSSACIYRVSKTLRTMKESAYTPRLIAIGPLHREDKHLQIAFQHVKMSYTNHLLSRLTAGIHDLESAEEMKFAAAQECLAKLKTLVDDAKNFYAEEVTLDEEMMLVDGCFILELFYGYFTKTRPPETDPFCVALNFFNVKSDLVLLENQIPFIVLEKLFQLTVGRIPDCPNKDWSLTDYVRRYYADRMMPQRNSNSGSAKSTWCSSCDCVLRVFGCTAEAAAKEEEGVQSGKNIDHHRSTAKYYHHILHYLHDGYLPPLDKANQINFDYREMPSASELVYAGVEFAPDTGNDLFKFKFSEPKGLFRWCHRARFEIPPFTLYDETESYLRNLIALEQCCPGVSLHVSSYAFVMDLLVDNEKDIQVLEKAGVLKNYLGGTAEDAADLFNKLSKEIVEGGYFADTCIRATKYSKGFWPKNMAHVRRTYFKSPWTFIAFCVGFIVFIMTVLQFVHDFFKKSG